MHNNLLASHPQLIGKLLHRFVITLVDVDYLALVVRVLPRSYVYSFIITLLFAAFTTSVGKPKLLAKSLVEPAGM